MHNCDKFKTSKNLLFDCYNLAYGYNSRRTIYYRSKDNLSLVQRLKLEAKLEVHNGCVNSICWNDTGEYILSGSDDQHLVITDPFKKKILISLHSGHRANIFSAKFLPNTQDRKIVSCSGDGCIYYTNLDDVNSCSEFSFNCHFGTVYELVTLPHDSNSFLSCGEDGTVRFFDLRQKSKCLKEDCNEDILINCRRAVTSLAVHPLIPYQLAVGCSDGTVRIFDQRKLGTRGTGNYCASGSTGMLSRFCAPSVCSHPCRITALDYSDDGEEILVNYSCEYLYSFDLKQDGRTCKEFTLDVAATTESAQSGKSQAEPSGKAMGANQPPIKRLRLRGDWSDTGPNARPESERGQQQQGEDSASSIMQRLSDMLTRWLDRANQQPLTVPGRSTEDSGLTQVQEEETESENSPRLQQDNEVHLEHQQVEDDQEKRGRETEKESSECRDETSKNEAGDRHEEREEEKEEDLMDHCDRRQKDVESNQQSSCVGIEPTVEIVSTDSELVSENVKPVETSQKSTSGELSGGVDSETAHGQLHDVQNIESIDSANLVKEEGRRVLSETDDRNISLNGNEDFVHKFVVRILDDIFSNTNISTSNNNSNTSCDNPLVQATSSDHTNAMTVTTRTVDKLERGCRVTEACSDDLDIVTHMSQPMSVSTENISQSLAVADASDSSRHEFLLQNGTLDNRNVLSGTDSSLMTISNLRDTRLSQSIAEDTIEEVSVSKQIEDIVKEIQVPTIDLNQQSCTRRSGHRQVDLHEVVGSNVLLNSPLTSPTEFDCFVEDSSSASVEPHCADVTTIQPMANEASEASGSSGLRRRRIGHSGPPTGDFQLSGGREPTSDDDNNDDELMRAPRRGFGPRDLERNFAALRLQKIFRKRQERREMEEESMKDLPHPVVKQIYRGHRNSRTMMKEARFWGRDFVMTGSDCGHVFIWNRYSAELVHMLQADTHVVNCVRPHPYSAILATSGIDYDIKIWSPINAEKFFHKDVAESVMRRNEVMLAETRDTVTVPASFMLRMLASLDHFRASNRGAGLTREDVPTNENRENREETERREATRRSDDDVITDDDSELD